MLIQDTYSAKGPIQDDKAFETYLSRLVLKEVSLKLELWA